MGIVYSDEGHHGMTLVEKADRFSEWMYSEIKPYLHGNIIEIGSGIGIFSSKVIRDFRGSKIVVSDIDPHYVQHLTERFKSNKNVSAIRLDFSKSTDFKQVKHRADSVFALNVLEHVKDDVGALNNAYDLLAKGGTCIILVPAHKFLFNSLDKVMGHYRRYTKKELVQTVAKTKFKVKRVFYFNFFSIFGWYLNGNILRKTTILESGMGLLNLLVPFLRFFEKHLLRQMLGLSLIIVLEK
ncbi:MAG: class I SAM-dependent methyltransferase [archaeon]